LAGTRHHHSRRCPSVKGPLWFRRFYDEEVPMNALRLAAFLAAFATVSVAHVPMADAQTAATLGRPAGPTRQVDTKVPQPGARGKIFPLGSSWIAVSLNGKPFTGERPSFRLDDQMRATGFS